MVKKSLLLLNKTAEQEAIDHRTKARRQRGHLRRPRVGRECERKLRKPFVLRNGFVLTYSSGTRYPECASSIHTTISTRPAKCKSADLTLQHAGGQDQLYSEKQADLFTEREADSPWAGAKAFFSEKSSERGGQGLISITVINYLTISNVVGLHLIHKQVNLCGQLQ